MTTGLRRIAAATAFLLVALPVSASACEAVCLSAVHARPSSAAAGSVAPACHEHTESAAAGLYMSAVHDSCGHDAISVTGPIASALPNVSKGSPTEHRPVAALADAAVPWTASAHAIRFLPSSLASANTILRI